MPGLISLGPADLARTLDLLRAEPVPNVFLLDLARRTGLRAGRNQVPFHGDLDEAGRLIGVGAFGSTLLMYIPDSRSVSAFAREALNRRGQWTTLLGDERFITPLWRVLSPTLGPPVEEHTEEWRCLSREAFQPGSGEPIPVSITTPAELPRVVPLRWRMRAEGLGAPLSLEEKERVEARCADSARTGHLFHVERQGRVVFTATFSAVTPEATQLSSVFTEPDARGQGIATRALTWLLWDALKTSPRVCLFVESGNTPAMRLYERLGFIRTGTARHVRVG